MRQKKLLTCLACLVLLGTIHAQFSKGDKMVSASIGTASYNSGKSDVSIRDIGNYTGHSSNFGLNINPAYGWFVNESTALGPSIIINPNSGNTFYESDGTTFQKDESNSFNIGIGGFVRSYLKKSESFIPFGQFGLNLGISNINSSGYAYYTNPDVKISYDAKSSGGFFANASFTVGATKMIGELTGLDFYIGYTYSYTNNTVNRTTLRDLGVDGVIDETLKNETTTKFTNHGFIIGVGFQVFLKGKK